jgi:hypothetical protein
MEVHAFRFFKMGTLFYLFDNNYTIQAGERVVNVGSTERKKEVETTGLKVPLSQLLVSAKNYRFTDSAWPLYSALNLLIVDQ